MCELALNSDGMAQLQPSMPIKVSANLLTQPISNWSVRELCQEPRISCTPNQYLRRTTSTSKASGERPF